LFRVAEELEASAAAVGHTHDDQAETVLLALLRGGGIEALAGMAPVSRPVVRPLLEVTREQTEAFCRALGLRPRRDPMNEDPALMRAAIRSRVIPTLEEAVGRGVRSTLVRTAGHLREDAALLRDLAEDAGKLVVAPTEDSEDRMLHAAALAGLPVPLASRIVRGVLREMGVVPEAAHVEAVIGLAGARRGARTFLPGGLIAVRDREYVRLSRPSPAGSLPARPRR
jgi:tRNA(Ile)-lysidine synthase